MWGPLEGPSNVPKEVEGVGDGVGMPRQVSRFCRLGSRAEPGVVGERWCVCGRVSPPTASTSHSF